MQINNGKFDVLFTDGTTCGVTLTCFETPDGFAYSVQNPSNGKTVTGTVKCSAEDFLKNMCKRDFSALKS